GNCHTIWSTGFVSEISFSGQGFFPSTASETAFRRRRVKPRTIWKAQSTPRAANGATISNPNDENDVVICAADSLPAAPLQIPDLDAQDPWESRNAWKDVP